MHVEPPAAEEGFPRTYRMDARARRVVNGFLVVIAGFFLFFTMLQVAHGGPLHDLIVLDLVVTAWVPWIGSACNKRVILHQDAIEVVSWFYSRKLSFAEIRGRKTRTTGSSRRAFPYGYVLVPSDKSKRRLVLPAHLHTDQFLRDWIETIPKIPR
jgi:hypothetical protein